MTFSTLLGWLGEVGAQSSEGVPGSGTRLSVLALELPRSITPEVAGLTVGISVGVIGIIAVLLLVGRTNRRPSRRVMHADDVVFIPPYGTMPRDTPLPPQAFATPGRAYVASPAAPPASVAGGHALYGHGHFQGAALPFVPSSQLSARVFAKMGYAVDADDERDAPNADPMLAIEIDMLHEEELEERVAPVAAPVTVAPVVALSSSTPPNGAPPPLGVIASSSSAMRAAPIADLAFDDGPTEIGETYFDEPPQPRRRTDPPRIRPIAQSAPRFPELPQVTPPPARAQTRSS